MKKKVLIILNRLVIGGPAKDILSVIKHLNNEFEFILVVGKKGNDEYELVVSEEEARKFTLIYLPSLRRRVRPLTDLLCLFELKRIIRQYKPHIVHTHGAKPGTLGRMAAWLEKVPAIIHTYHGHVFHSYFPRPVTAIVLWIEKMLARISTKIIALSSIQKDEFSATYKLCAADKIEVIPLGIEADWLEDADGEKRKRMRTEFLLDEGDIAVGMIGRLVPVKNHKLFAEAAKRILVGDKRSNIHFFIIGDGPERSAIEHYLSQSGITFSDRQDIPRKRSFIFTSWRNDMDQVLAGLDIVVLTSKNEGAPLSLLEAEAAGKPVISTDAGGVREIVINGETGIVLSQNNAEALYVALDNLIVAQSLREKMGKRGKDLIHTSFSKEAEVLKLKNLYKNTL